jgi:hypothetical protein
MPCLICGYLRSTRYLLILLREYTLKVILLVIDVKNVFNYPPFLMHFSELILLFRQLIIPLFLATLIVLLIYIINAYMTLDNACSELTSTWTFKVYSRNTKGYPEAVRRRRKDNSMIKRKRTNNDITQKTKERTTWTLHNRKVELWCPAKVSSFSSICDTRRVMTDFSCIFRIEII